MAEALVTQVSQNSPPPTGTKNPPEESSSSCWSCFTSLFCCGKRSDQPAVPEGRPAVIAHTTANPGTNLLPPLEKRDEAKRCLVLDLDETLVHSSFQPVPEADFVVPIEIEGHIHHVYVQKRPHVDTFLKQVGEYFEVVLFTASLSKYADPVVDLLDTNRVFRHRLFREHCVFFNGIYVKDLSRLGRDVNRSIIIDNSPTSYSFHPDHAVPVTSWFNDKNDTELLTLLPVLTQLASNNMLPAHFLNK
eukprot:m.232832 g.232832  ORF g.232832 m.232832 type:complete len:247 (+) comp12420_c0_seq1:55-795(+)